MRNHPNPTIVQAISVLRVFVSRTAASEWSGTNTNTEIAGLLRSHQRCSEAFSSPRNSARPKHHLWSWFRGGLLQAKPALFFDKLVMPRQDLRACVLADVELVVHARCLEDVRDGPVVINPKRVAAMAEDGPPPRRERTSHGPVGKHGLGKVTDGPRNPSATLTRRVVLLRKGTQDLRVRSGHDRRLRKRPRRALQLPPCAGGEEPLQGTAIGTPQSTHGQMLANALGVNYRQLFHECRGH